MSGSRASAVHPAAVAALDALAKAGREGDPLRRAVWLDALDQRLRPHLPPPLAAHARLANVDGARLVYLVEHPVWHARLRLAGPELLDVARSLGLAVSDFVVKTAKQPFVSGAAEGNARKPIPMSPHTAQALQAALASLQEVAAGTPKNERE